MESKNTPQQANALISVQHLRKTFKQAKREPGFMGVLKALFKPTMTTVEAVKDLSFSIKEGEFVGFVGPNGAGKTTTLKMLSGILYPTSGEVSVLGYIPWKREHPFQKRFSLVMGQKNQMWWDLPVIESFEFNKVVYEIPDEIYKAQKDLLVELLDIGDLMDRAVRKLSLGQRMKCELATALLHKPKVLFLDEPTIGLDVISQKKIRDFLKEYNRRERATIILTSHYMEDIRRLCDRVVIIDHGELIYDGDYRTLIETRADTKTIEVVFSEKIPQEKLQVYGIVLEYSETTCSIRVPRKKVTEITTELLKTLPIDDISIKEESMEDIVSEIFQKSRT